MTKAVDHWAVVRRLIGQSREILLTTHVNPDGDGAGSEMALRYFLESRGKRVRVVNDGELPPHYRFLDPDGVVSQPEAPAAQLRGVDLVIVLDTGKAERLGRLRQAVLASGAPLVCIDHHPAEESFGDIRVVDPEASSTGEMVLALLRSFGEGTRDPRLAEALYAAIATDTGQFRFSNTNARALRAAAELVEAGADPVRVFREVYERGSTGRFRLLGETMSSLHLECGGKLAWFAITREALARHGVTPPETDRFVDEPRVIEEVEVVVYFLELEDGRVRVSLRSKGRIPVSGLAMRFGGGGHAFASGIRIRGSL
ncbi:MAG: bifunctional oligoribonuclease/PAP phosphatase NrnA, partial [Nitrospinota bacterium]